MVLTPGLLESKYPVCNLNNSDSIPAVFGMVNVMGSSSVLQLYLHELSSRAFAPFIVSLESCARDMHNVGRYECIGTVG